MLYLLVNVGVIAIPLAFSWSGSPNFFNRWRPFIISCSVVGAVFIVWDILFAFKGIWGFNGEYLVGFGLFGLPLEEWLFFLCIPYACVFTHIQLQEKGFGFSIHQFTPWMSVLLLVSCLALALNFSGQLYTISISLLLAAFLLYMLLRQPAWAGALWVSFLVLLIPFLITNGVLTGLKFWEYPFLNFGPGEIDDQIVWYDNESNAGVRIFSIPIEDFLYAFLLIGLNVAVFERLTIKTRSGATNALPE